MRLENADKAYKIRAKLLEQYNILRRLKNTRYKDKIIKFNGVEITLGPLAYLEVQDILLHRVEGKTRKIEDELRDLGNTF